MSPKQVFAIESKMDRLIIDNIYGFNELKYFSGHACPFKPGFTSLINTKKINLIL